MSSAWPSAVIFDFDGLIMDTETPTYEAWQATYRKYGVPEIPMEKWLEGVGLAVDLFDPFAELEAAVGRPLDRMAVMAERRAMKDELLADVGVLPGVVDWLDQCRADGVPVGIATSSGHGWARSQLQRVGMSDRFDVISQVGPDVPGKPNPTVYLRACEQLGADPSGALALEDSPAGITAAQTAGMRCVAVPSPLTVTLDTSHADLVVDSLADLTLADARAKLGPTSPES